MAQARPRKLNVRELLELERQIYQESIDRVLQQQEQLNAGVLEDFVRRCRPFEADRERELQVAQTQYQFSKQDAQSLLDFDLQQAEDVFRTDREQLKRKLLEGVKRRRARIEKRLKTLDKTEKSNVKVHNKKKTRGFASLKENKLLQPELLEKQLGRAQRRTRKNFNFRHLSDGVLPTPVQIMDDVMDECENLQRHRERDEAAKMMQEEGLDSKTEVKISEDGQKLTCRHRGENGDKVETFCVGDTVVLESQLTEEDFYGFVAEFTSDDVKLMLVCGTHARVAIARLSSGQCALHKQPGVVESIDKRECGDDECYGKVPPPGVATSLEELLRDPPDVRRRAAAVMNRLKRKTTVDIRRGF